MFEKDSLRTVGTFLLASWSRFKFSAPLAGLTVHFGLYGKFLASLVNMLLRFSFRYQHPEPWGATRNKPNGFHG
jgi:hypothetical protein